jgi:hypothetical protein
MMEVSEYTQTISTTTTFRKSGKFPKSQAGLRVNDEAFEFVFY